MSLKGGEQALTATSPNLWRAWVIFAASSLLAVLAGCGAAWAHQVPSRAWLLNIAAWIVGAACAAALRRMRAPAARAWLLVAGAGLLATLVSPGLSGVHRWISLGPLRLNAAQLLLPAAVVAMAWVHPASPARPLFILGALAILACQPDASQAAALTGASIAVLVAAPGRRVWDLATAVGAVALAILAWTRPDPLAPVAEVEGVIGLAAAVSPLLAGLAVLALASAVAAPLLARAPSPAGRAAAFGLTVYLALSAAAPLLGAFPVPLVGMGVSAIVGAWLGFGALTSSRKAQGEPG